MDVKIVVDGGLENGGDEWEFETPDDGDFHTILLTVQERDDAVAIEFDGVEVVSPPKL